MKSIGKLFFLTAVFLVSVSLSAQVDSKNILWNLNRTDSIGGFLTLPLNKFPQATWDSGIKALEFNGINEAVLINTNPLEGAEEFTIEAIIKPDSTIDPANKEQRFLHIRNGSDDNRRILLELRFYKNQSWAFDTFIKSENSRCTLIDTTKTHPAGKWHHVALVYKNGTMTHFVNGVKELEGKVDFLPITNGRISIGARQDPRNWFKGAISKIRFTKCALDPNNFLSK